MRFALLAVASLLMVVAASASGEIYKYKDNNGNWQFTDKPLENKGSATYGQSVTSNSDSSTKHDLRKRLMDKYKPGNKIEQASLATVTIESSIGSGSGFFISENGYIVTNKHVVRPNEMTQVQKMKKELEESQRKYEEYKRQFAEEEETLNAMLKRLKRYENAIAKAVSKPERKDLERTYSGYKDEYDERRENYFRLKKDYDKSRREFESARSEFNVKTSISQLANSFTIILKNSEKVRAKLISISKKHDLALLKLDDYKTPSLPLNNTRIHQAMPVYAVGSPLGIRDAVTSGIVTGINEEHILTDTKILPGNSGGPLLNDAGQVIGVNTARLSSEVAGEGFGQAIGVDIVRKEFGQYLH